MLRGAYTAFVALSRPLFTLLAYFSPKVRAVLEPRVGLLDRWQKAELGSNRLWFHVSSVGELEQVRPVLEILGARGHSILLSYFSNSVPRLVQKWEFVQHADYLPLDYPEEMDALFSILDPRLLVLNRYDLWPNHLEAAARRGVPVVLVNASTPPLGAFGRASLWVRRRLFLAISAWTFVDAAAASNWEPYMRSQARGLVTGNPRVDRALTRVERALVEGKARERLARWRRHPFCLVAGSTWPEDEAVLLDAWSQLSEPRSLVIVPHEPEEAHLRTLERELERRGFRYGRYSLLEESKELDVLIVDQRGMLAELYGIGQLAYVGGGFRREIHSIIEPAAHELPIAFGPSFRRSPEAVTLQCANAAFALPRRGAAQALAHWLERLRKQGKERARAQESLRIFLQIHRGAGERVAGFLEEGLAKS